MRRLAVPLLVALLPALALPALAGCGRIKSAAKRVLRGDDNDKSSAAPPVMSGPAPATPIGPHPRILLDPKTLETLRARVAAGAPTWKALDAKCASRMNGPVEYPDGSDYPTPGIGEGYQGEEYWQAMHDIALCSAVLRTIDAARAKALAARGADLLSKMSDTIGPHAVSPLRDDGFGIRFFATAMAIGYDWLYDELSPELRAKVRAALAMWLDTYDAKGFAREHPQGNYFAGYYAAKAYAALATQDDDPKALTWFADWHERMHLKMVVPYYSKHLVGGGWPEGWNYGALATLNMTWPAWATQTAKGRDLFRNPVAPFAFPFDQSIHLLHFAWPDRIHVDDRGTNYEGDAADATAPLWTLTVLPALLRREGDPFAATLQRYAREIRDRREKKAPPWMDFLFWDAAAPEADFTKLPLSYVAWGMNTVALRSAWDENATWASFTAGPHVANAEAGHMQFDQGSLAVVRGGRPVLVNAATAVRRREAGQPSLHTSGGNDPVYEELFGDHDKDKRKGNRTVFNILYARMKPAAGSAEPDERYGQIAAMPPKPKTKLARFEEKDAWVFLRGEHLEDMYRRGKRGEARVAAWSREVLYVRPSLFFIDDKSEVGEGDLEQWLAFHLAAPAAARAGEPSTFDAGPADRFAGTLAIVKPVGATFRTVDLYDRKRVTRVEARPSNAERAQRWLTVLDASGTGPGAAKIQPLDGGVHGATAVMGDQSTTFVAAPHASRATYSAKTGTHYVSNLAPKQDFKIAATLSGDAVSVVVERGGSAKSSDAGVLAFRVGRDGQVTAGAK